MPTASGQLVTLPGLQTLAHFDRIWTVGDHEKPRISVFLRSQLRNAPICHADVDRYRRLAGRVLREGQEHGGAGRSGIEAYSI